MTVTTPCIEAPLTKGRERTKGGYIRAPLSGRQVLIHRWVVEQVEGRRLPWPEEVVMHLCDNPPCFRYDHLRLATYAENNADCRAKGRQIVNRGEAHHKLQTHLG